MKKRILFIFMILVLTVFTFIPYLNVFAIQESVTFEEMHVGEFKYVAVGTNMTEYINTKKGAFINRLTQDGLISLQANADYNTFFAVGNDNYYAVIDHIDDPVNGVHNVAYKYVHVSYAPANAITITFDKNNGYGTMEDILVEPNDGVLLPECDFEGPYGQTFDKWYIEGIGNKNPGDVINVSTNTTVKAIWKDIPTEKINKIDIIFNAPEVGENVSLEHHEAQGYSYDVPNQFPDADSVVHNNGKYYVDGGIYVKSLPSINPQNYDDYFEGTYEEGKEYYALIAIAVDEGYSFDTNANTTVTVNGKSTGFELDPDNGNNPYFIIIVKFIPSTENMQEYNLTSGDYSVKFKSRKNVDYELKFVDIMTLTDEELEAYTSNREEYEEILKIIKNNTKSYGNLLSVYAIEIASTNFGTYSGKTEVKIKLTDEMKKYNTFKFIYLDENNNFKVVEIVDFKIEGDYLIGTLPHLSAYALVGSYVEQTNPNTSDNIGLYIVLFGISVVGLTAIVLKKRLS